MLSQRGEEPLPVERLGQVLRGAQGIAEVPVVHQGQHDDGNLREVGICLERRQHGPPVESRHDHVKGDRVRAQLLRQAEPFLPAGRHGHAEAFLGEKALDQIADGRVVVDDEHCFRAVGRCDRERRLWPSLRHGGRNVHGEGASAAGLALHRDVAAHHAGQAPAQREPEPRAAVAPRHRRIGLGELLEEPVHLFGRHPDPRVAHREHEAIPAVPCFTRCREPDHTLFGELAGIAQEIEESLANLGQVGVHVPGVGRAAHVQPVAVLLRQGLDHGRDISHRAGHGEGLEVELHLPRLDLREIEDGVDQLEQVLARRVDLGQVGDEGFLAEVLGFLLEHLAVADDGVERRAQLVGHVGQELRLVAAHRLQLAEEARVLDSQGRLGREGLQQVDDVWAEGPCGLPVYHEPADDPVLPQERDGQERANARAQQDILQSSVIGPLGRDIGDLDRLVGLGEPAHGALALEDARFAAGLHQLFLQALLGPQQERFRRLVVLVDGATIRARELGRSGDDRRENCVEIQRRADGLPYLAERGELVDRAGELMRPRLELREEAHVLDGDHGLIGKGLEQLDLLAREWPWGRPRVDGDGSDGDAKAHHGHRQYASESSAPQAGEHVVRVFEDIGYVDRLSGQNRPTAG